MPDAPIQQPSSPVESSVEMQESEERYRALFLQEQNRARHLSLINEVQKCALATRDNNTFLQQVTRAVQSHFSDCDVTFFLCEKARDHTSYGSGAVFSPGGFQEGDGGDMTVVAAAGEHGLSPEIGTHWPSTAGLPGQAAQLRRTSYFDPGTPAGSESAWQSAQLRAGMCVPIITNGHLLGVICMQSAEESGIDARDAVALQTAAAIIASHLEAVRLFDEMRELSAFNQTLITTMLHSMMVVDGAGVIKVVNARLCQTLGLVQSQILNQPVERVFGESISYGGAPHGETLREAILEVTRSGTPHELPEIQLDSPEGAQIFDVRLFRVYFRGEAQVVLLLINLTRRWRMFRHLQLMNEIGRLFQSSLDINEVLHIVLTCITAGAGLGFNRAFLLLLHDEAGEASASAASDQGSRQELRSGTLRGAMALGPSSPAEASRVWSELGSKNLTLAEMLQGSDPLDLENLTLLQQQTLTLDIDLHNPCFPAIEHAMSERRTLCVEREEFFDTAHFEAADGSVNEDDTVSMAVCEECPPTGRYREQYDAALELLTGSQIAIAPLLAKDRVVGVVLADNLYSGAPIEPDDVQMLDVLAQQAGLTVANALAYQALQDAQKELVTAERLAVVGEMAARVSHEIRNPLATVGGFARSILKHPHDSEDVERKAQIIVGEVTRLEELLGDLLDMARPRGLNAQPESLNAVVEHAILLADADIQTMKVHVEKTFDDRLPSVALDRSRAVQAILNVVRNGAQAMPGGGVLTVSTRRSPNGRWAQVEVRDNGIGMSGNALKHVFDPFFSTKLKGSGLGLAVTRRIMQDHDGEVDVFSEPDKGTNFVLSFPLTNT
jgi:signal transduction histidine kinase